MSRFDSGRVTAETSIRLVEYHDTLESTSRLAADLLPELLPQSPALVLTSSQTAGRGRGSHSWWSTAGALTFTLVLDAEKLDLPTERRSLISLVVGAAVRRIVSRLLPSRKVGIKWPNDVLIGDRKVCGILTEQRFVQNRAGLLIGIGLNVNNSLAVAPDEIRQRATSLFDLTGSALDLTQVLIDLLNVIDECIQELSAGSTTLIAEVDAHSLLNGCRVTISSGDAVYQGLCVGVDATGSLILQTDAGPQQVLAGTVLDWKPV